MKHKKAYIVFALAFALNMVFWLSVRGKEVAWANVPPVPGKVSAVNMALGDKQFAYRSIGLFLQNLGSTSGRVVPLVDYDFSRLVDWFYLADSLDSDSAYIGTLASLYYGGSQKPEDVNLILPFLEDIGTRNSGERWLLIAYAMKLAGHELKDPELALYYANILANLDNPNMPEWTRRAPAMILKARGEREAAYEIMLNILKSESDNIRPGDMKYLISNICVGLLEPDEASHNSLCKDVNVNGN